MRQTFIGWVALGVIATACGDERENRQSRMGEPPADPRDPVDIVPGEERGFLTVPLNDNHDGGETIELAYIRIQEKNDAEPILVHFGGPGVSAVAFLTNFVNGLPREFRERYAFVGLDEIGVGDSPALGCSNLLPSATLAHPFVAASDTELEQFGEDFAEGCSGSAVFDETGTARYARDIDRLREELGYERLHLLGFSYGAEVALHYAALFPERVGRIVLDSPTDTRVSFVETLALQGHALAAAFDAFVAWCDERTTCTIDPGDLNSVIEDLSSGIDESRIVDAGRLLSVILRALTFEPRWPLLAISLEEFIDRPESMIQRLGRQSAEPPLNTFVATTCTDLPIDSTAEIFDAMAQFTRDYRSQLSLNFFAPQFDLAFPCAFWDADAERIAWDSVLPELPNGDSILVISAIGDTQTPRAFTEGLLDAIPGLRAVSVDEVSHALSLIGPNPCLADAAIEFFDEGTVSVVECEKSALFSAVPQERGVAEPELALHEPFPWELVRARR